MAYQLQEINRRIQSDVTEFLAECDENYAQRVSLAADKILSNLEASPIVLLSGPSGSGKTTTAMKIAEELQSRGEEILIPKYEFVRQMRNDSRGTPLRLGKNEIVVFEGIHALNDSIAGRHPEAAKLYISARSNINEGSVLRFKGTWMRLTRRAVRDYNFRGTGVEDTLDMWANVRRGEKLYISPFKNKADIIFDSSLPYEVSVMKHYALPLLEAVPEDNVRRGELLELIDAFQFFQPIDPELVDKSSLLREFIGGGSYHYG